MIIGEAADGLEAVTMVARFTLDLVIRDIVMSCLNGIQEGKIYLSPAITGLTAD